MLYVTNIYEMFTFLINSYCDASNEQEKNLIFLPFFVAADQSSSRGKLADFDLGSVDKPI